MVYDLLQLKLEQVRRGELRHLPFDYCVTSYLNDWLRCKDGTKRYVKEQAAYARMWGWSRAWVCNNWKRIEEEAARWKTFYSTDGSERSVNDESTEREQNSGANERKLPIPAQKRHVSESGVNAELTRSERSVNTYLEYSSDQQSLNYTYGGGGNKTLTGEGSADDDPPPPPARKFPGVKVPLDDAERATLTRIVRRARSSMKRLRQPIPLETLWYHYFGRYPFGIELSELADLDRTYDRGWIEAALAGAASKGRNNVQSVRRWIETWEERLLRQTTRDCAQAYHHPTTRAGPPLPDPPPDAVTEVQKRYEIEEYGLTEDDFERCETNMGTMYVMKPEAREQLLERRRESARSASAA